MDKRLEYVDYYKKLVEPLLKEYVAKQEPKELYKLLQDIISRGGKRIRPVLCMLSCEAVGGNAKDALITAAAVELIHNLTLIHDDIEDASQLRRGKPCLHILYGEALAINAGDGLFSIGYKAIVDNFRLVGNIKGMAILEILTDTMIDVCEGQAIDISWSKQRRWDLTYTDYVNMLRKKTAALIAASCKCGAIIGNATKNEIEAFNNFGYNLGILFQIQDDILNLTGDIRKYKKEIGGDINEGKRTGMVLHAIENCNPAERKRLITILDKKENSAEEIREAIEIIKSKGSIEVAKQHVNDLALSAIDSLKMIKESEFKEKLLEIVDYFLHREQ